MQGVDQQIGNIGTGLRNERYGDLNKSTVQGLYKKYAAWTKINQPEKTIMPFKDWIKWAKGKGIVKNYNSDGDEAAITYNVGVQKAPVEELPKVVNQTGKKIAKILIVLTIIGVGLTFINFSKPEIKTT